VTEPASTITGIDPRPAPEADDEAAAEPIRRRWPTWRVDISALAVYIIGALWVTGHGWVDPNGRTLGFRAGDVQFGEWMLANMAHAVSHLENPFYTHLQNAPVGVNLMTNVGLQLPGIVLTPVTLLFGPAIAYLTLITANLFGTAYAWYFVLSRRFVASRVAAFLGGLFCAFAPALVSHSSGHPHITAQWLIPFIVWQVLALAEGRSLRRGIVLGVLITAQVLISEEALLMTAVGVVIALVVYAASRPRAAREAIRPFAAGLGIAAVVAAVLCAYPLWMQFFGPQHRFGAPGTPDMYALKIGSFFAYAQQSLAGSPATVKGLTPNGSEQAAFFGWPLIVLALTIVVWLRRDVMVRALAVAGAVAASLAIGTTLTHGTQRLSFPAPYDLLKNVPIFEDVVVARFALITTAVIGILLAIAVDRFLTLDRAALHAIGSRTSLRLIGVGVLVAVLLPLAPLPLPVATRNKVPDFITSGAWQAYVAPGHTLVPVPVTGGMSITWAAAAKAGFDVPEGYFLGPTSPTDATGRWGVVPRPTAALLTAVANGTAPPTVTDAQRAQAAADAAYWKADALVLPKRARSELLTVMTNLYGQPQSVDDVWVWELARR
jgi:hypothetical protein